MQVKRHLASRLCLLTGHFQPLSIGLFRVIIGIALSCSFLQNNPQRGELCRIRIPALHCFGCRIDSRLNSFRALGSNGLDQSLLVGGVCLRPFVSGDQLGMGNRWGHRRFPISKSAIFGAFHEGHRDTQGHAVTQRQKSKGGLGDATGSLAPCSRGNQAEHSLGPLHEAEPLRHSTAPAIYLAV